VADTEALVQRYGKDLELTMPRVQAAMQCASDEVRQQLQAQPQRARQDLNHSLLAQRLGLVPQLDVPRAGVPSQTLAQPGTTDTALALAIQRVAAAVQGSGMNLNQLLHEVLAAVLQGTGFERVIFVFKDRGSSAMHGRFAVGQRTRPLPEVFRLTLDDGTDGFAEVVRQGHDLWVPEAKADVMRPVWHLQAFDAGCYLLLPLRLKGQAFGLIYAEHAQPQGVVLTAKALSQLGTLRDQTVMAFKRHSA
jgi:hypothetical protein